MKFLSSRFFENFLFTKHRLNKFSFLKMSNTVPSVLLNDGNKIPQLGLGTWKSPTGEVANAVYWAIKYGYRHIDCAFIYQNESEVGQGIRRAIDEGFAKREDLFITTKCWLTYLHADRVAKCLKSSLDNLKLDYVDLYLIHWPMAFRQTDDSYFPDKNGLIEKDETIDLCSTWKAFEELKNSNLTKSIGVSNFNSVQLQRLLSSCTIKPTVNQIECHPYLNQDKLIKFCHENQIHIVSYCPLGSTPVTSNTSHSSTLTTDSPRLLNDPIVNELAKKYGKSTAQILIRFHIDKDLIVIPKSTNEQRIKENLQVFDFKLSKEDIDKLIDLNRSFRYCLFDKNGLKQHKEYPFLIDF